MVYPNTQANLISPMYCLKSNEYGFYLEKSFCVLGEGGIEAFRGNIISLSLDYEHVDAERRHDDLIGFLNKLFVARAPGVRSVRS